MVGIPKGVGSWTATCTPSPGLQDHLQFPSDVPDVPATAQDLIRRLLCRQEERLGRGGLDDFRNHPFFEGVDWERLATSTAPYIPELRGPVDTSNFDVDDDTLNEPVSSGFHCTRKTALTLAGQGKPEVLQSSCWVEDEALAFRKLTGVMVHLGWFTSTEVGCWTPSVILVTRSLIKRKALSGTWKAMTIRAHGNCGLFRWGPWHPPRFHLSRRSALPVPGMSPGS